MALLAYKRPWTWKPPLGTRINRNHPIGKHVNAALVYYNNRLIDVVNNKLSTADSSTRRVGPQGELADYNDQQTAFANHSGYHQTGKMSIGVFCDIDALTNYNALVSCANTSSVHGWELRVGNGPTDSKIMMHRADAGGFKQWYSSSNQITS